MSGQKTLQPHERSRLLQLQIVFHKESYVNCCMSVLMASCEGNEAVDETCFFLCVATKDGVRALFNT